MNNITLEASNADRVRSAIGGANGIYVSDVKDAGDNRFTAIVQFNSQPVHGHRDSAWIVSKQLTKHCIDHTIENSTEKSAVGDGLNGKYGVWEHLVSVHIHHPEMLKPAYINEEVMLDLKNSIDENRILELVHKKFFKENGRDPKNAKELLSFAKKKNGKTAGCEQPVEKHEKEMHEGAVGLVVNVLKAIDSRVRRSPERLDEIFDDTARGRAKLDRYVSKAHKSWMTNFDAENGAQSSSALDGEYSKQARASRYKRDRNKRLTGIGRANKISQKFSGVSEERLNEIFDKTRSGRAKLKRYLQKAHDHQRGVDGWWATRDQNPKAVDDADTDYFYRAHNNRSRGFRRALRKV